MQETLLGEAATGMVAALFVFGEDAEMVAVNEAACKLTGWTREELLANSADALALDPEHAAHLRRELSASGRLVASGRIRTKTGRAVEVGYVASMTRVAGLPFIVLVVAALPKRPPRARSRRAVAAAS